jgi:hypothetical protein
MSKAEEKHIEQVKELPCSVCNKEPPSDAHHILEGRIPGRKCSGFCTIPLCKDCHQGSHNGIHGNQFMWKIMKKTELDCLAETIKKLFYY